jgi:aryl-alcohol dehydrogenase-like predicted oxidoreductase
VIVGGWQLSAGHGPAVATPKALDAVAAYAVAGLTAFDCADIYTGAEALLGALRARLTAGRRDLLAAFRVHTKFVPDLSALPCIDGRYVCGIIDRSRQRLCTDRLDLVQLHWWDYAVPGLETAARWLVELQREGRIAHLGGTNFDAPHTERLLAAGMPLVSMQVQYSLLDRRPGRGLAALCARYRVGLLCYGVLAGGFLSERWLGAPEPKPPLANRSLTKYRLMIEEFGGWARFQALLAVLSDLARRHGVGIGTVAIRWALDRPGVAAVIVGARDASHLADTLAVFALRLDDADRAAIEAALADAPGPAGDCFALERDRAGPHGRIMKYDQNTA